MYCIPLRAARQSNLPDCYSVWLLANHIEPDMISCDDILMMYTKDHWYTRRSLTTDLDGTRFKVGSGSQDGKGAAKGLLAFTGLSFSGRSCKKASDNLPGVQLLHSRFLLVVGILLVTLRIQTVETRKK